MLLYNHFFAEPEVLVTNSQSVSELVLYSMMVKVTTKKGGVVVYWSESLALDFRSRVRISARGLTTVRGRRGEGLHCNTVSII